RYEQLRLLPIGSASAQFWNRSFSMVVSVGGYGLRVVVPLLTVILSSAVANVVGTLLALAVYAYAVSVLWTKRHSVTQTFLDEAYRSVIAVMGTVLLILALLWMWDIILYFIDLL